MLLGSVFVLIVIFMPDGVVPGLRRWWARVDEQRDDTPALQISGLRKVFGGLPATNDVSLEVMPGERRLIIGPNGAGKTTLFNLITGDLPPMPATIRLFGEEVSRLPPHQRAHRGIARTYQIITLFPKDSLEHNIVLALLGLSQRALERVSSARPRHRHLHEEARASARAGRPRAARGATDRRSVLRREATRRDRDGAGAKTASCCCSTSRLPASRARSAPR